VDPGGIDRSPHDSTQGVDLANELTLADAAETAQHLLEILAQPRA
jgi:hypothetical protein